MPTSATTAPPPGTLIKGAAWMLASVASFIAVALASRELSDSLPIIQILTLRALVGLGLLLLLAHRILPELRRLQDIALHGTRNLVHFAGQYCWTLSVALLPLAQAFALEFTMPLWAALFAWALLGERISKVRIMATAMSFTGVLIVLQPGVGSIHPAAFSALMAAACYGASAVLVKRLTRHSTSTTIVVWMVVMQLPMGLIALPFAGGWVTPAWADTPWILIAGIAGLSAHYAMAQALRLMDASIAIPIDFLRLPMVAIIGWLFYQEAISTAVILGATMIFSANFWALRSEAKRRPRT